MLTDAGINAALDATGVTHVGVHTAYPGGSGANEATGGSPAYARKATTPSAAASRQKQLVPSTVTFDLAAGTVAKWFVGWTASTAGSSRVLAPVGNTIQAVGTVAASDDLILSKGHGLTASKRVVFLPIANESLPTGITEGTDYYVLASGLTTDAFQISATDGGTAINFTTNGEMAIFDMVPDTSASQFQLQCTSLIVDGRFLKVT